MCVYFAEYARNTRASGPRSGKGSFCLVEVVTGVAHTRSGEHGAQSRLTNKLFLEHESVSFAPHCCTRGIAGYRTRVGCS
jgi:hypothetical protein